jgi:hypothetical protein
VFDQIDVGAVGQALREFVEQPRDDAFENGNGRLDGAWLQRFGERRPHARVIRRIVEHQAGRVVAEQRRRTELRLEQPAFVRAEVRVAIHLQAVVIARREIRPVGTAMDRVAFA